MRNKKIEKTYTKEKQSHAQDNIYVVRQFAYVHGVAGISLLSGKITKCGLRLQYFSLTKTQQQHHTKTLITKVNFYIQNGPKKNFMSAPAWAYRPKPPLHGLSLSKSTIKNHTILFESSRVVKPDQTKLGSTKPNKSPTWRLVQSPTSTAILQTYNPSFLQLILMSSS